MKITPLLRAGSLISGLILAQSTLAAESADYIWSGGPILTINDAQPRVESIAVKDGKILALGSSQDVKQHQGEKTVLQDMNYPPL